MRNDVRLPGVEFDEQIVKRSAACSQQFQFLACFGQVHRQRRPRLRPTDSPIAARARVARCTAHGGLARRECRRSRRARHVPRRPRTTHPRASLASRCSRGKQSPDTGCSLRRKAARSANRRRDFAHACRAESAALARPLITAARRWASVRPRRYAITLRSQSAHVFARGASGDLRSLNSRCVWALTNPGRIAALPKSIGRIIRSPLADRLDPAIGDRLRRRRAAAALRR